MAKTSFPAPDPSVLFYQRTRDDGRIEVASMQTISQNDKSGSWRGLFLTPGQAPYHMDQHTSELNQWEPVYALTQSDVTGIVERVAQRVVEIMDSKKASPADIVAKGMEVVEANTVQGAIEKATLEESDSTPTRANPKPCPHCGKKYKHQGHFQKHLQRAHGVTA